MLSATSSGLPQRPIEANSSPASRGFLEYGLPLLSVILQHLIACRAQFGPMLLEAGQNGEITLIDHRAAEALNVARARPLLLRRAAALLLLGDGASGNRYRQQGE